jgi:hypothetical protein
MSRLADAKKVEAMAEAMRLAKSSRRRVWVWTRNGAYMLRFSEKARPDGARLLGSTMHDGEWFAFADDNRKEWFDREYDIAPWSFDD